MDFVSFFGVILLALIWGPSFLFIKLAVSEVFPLFATFFRLVIATICLGGMLAYNRTPLPRSLTTYRHLFVMGLVHNAIAFSLFSISETKVDSSIAGICCGMTPLFTAFISLLWGGQETITPNKVIGIALGGIGLGFLFYPSLVNGAPAAELLGVAASLGAALCYGFVAVYAKKNLVSLPFGIAPFFQVLFAAILLGLASFIFEGGGGIASFQASSFIGKGSVVYLGVIGTVLPLNIYYFVLKRSGPTYLNMSTYLMTVVSALLGVTIMGEVLTSAHYLAIGCVFSGLFVASLPEKVKKLT